MDPKNDKFFDKIDNVYQDIPDNLRSSYNELVDHPLQSFEWGEFRKKTGVKIIRRGIFTKNNLSDCFTLSIHQISHTNYSIGYLPKGQMPTKKMINELLAIGKKERCIFIQIEPNVVNFENEDLKIKKLGLSTAAHPLFTKYTFLLDLDRSEEDLLKNMHPKTRYNIKVAQKHGVQVKQDNSKNAFQRYLELTEQTSKRQGFYAHTRDYHIKQWEALSTMNKELIKNSLSSHLLTGTYNKKILTTLMFFVFKDTLYYPYGASSSDDRNTMHSTITMWEGILLGKKMGLKKFDMWGAAESENPDKSNPYYGFHRFKQGFGAEYKEFIGSYDLVINKNLYYFYKIADKARWFYLRLKNKI